MKRALQLPAMWLLVAVLWLTGMLAAQASHIQGGQISYRYIGPGSGNTDRYSVTVTYFRDCTGIDLPTSLFLDAQSGGCNSTAQTVTLLPVGSPITGTPYCGRVQAQATCSDTSPLPLFQYQNFTGTIDLAPAAQWVLGVEDSARPNTANLTTQGSFRFEATINTLIPPSTPGQGIRVQNNSPQFSAQDLPVPYVPVNTRNTVSFAAQELDGDSLVYSLEAPLETCGSNNLYKVIPGTCAPATPLAGCTFVCPPNGPGTNYTPNLPIAVSYTNTPCGTNGTYTMTPDFNFVPETGLLTFTPNRFLNTLPIQGDNKYVVVCKISEYRRIAARATTANPRGWTLVGTVRRDFLVTVVAGSGNASPNIPTVEIDTATTVGGVVDTTARRTRIVVNSCNFNQARVTFTDPDNIVSPTNPVSANQLLTVTYTGATPLNTLLQNGDVGTAIVQGNGTTSPVLLLTFQPSPAYIGRVFTLTYRIEDDACPIKGTQIRVIEVEVVDGRRVRATTAVTSRGLNGTGIGGTSPVTICKGGTVNLRSDITAVDSVRQVIGGRARTVAQTYNLVWFAPGGRGLPATGLPNGATRTASTVTLPNTKNFSITVNPDSTTTYYLFANPRTGGFPLDNRGANVCGALDSIVVRVVPDPVLTITATDTLVCAGTEVTLRGAVTRTDNIVDSYTYRWSGEGTGNSTADNIKVTPQKTTTYTFTATGATPFGCDATKQRKITVVPNATAAFEADSVSFGTTGGGRSVPPITFTFRNTSTLSDGSTFAADTLRYTYQLVRDASGNAVTGRPEITFASGTTALSDVTLKLTEPGYYLIRLRAATGASGRACAYTIAQKTVSVIDFQIPNVITPDDGDPKNDYFVIKGNLFGSKLEIYNRWGRKVADYGDYRNQWKGEGLPAGTYYYLLTEPTGNKTKGWIEIVRGQ